MSRHHGDTMGYSWTSQDLQMIKERIRRLLGRGSGTSGANSATKKSVRVTTSPGEAIIEADYRGRGDLVSLVLVDRRTGEEIASVSAPSDGSFTFKISDPALVAAINDDATILDVFVDVTQRVRVGGFNNTRTESMSSFGLGDRTLFPYVTGKGNLSLAVGGPSPFEGTSKTFSLVVTPERIALTGLISTGSIPITSLAVRVAKRGGTDAFLQTIQYRRADGRSSFGLLEYEVEFEIPTSEVGLDQSGIDDIYDISYEITADDYDEPQQIAVDQPRYWNRRRVKDFVVESGDHKVVVVPYFTFKSRRLAFRTERFTHESYRELKRVSRFSWWVRILGRHKKIWLIGELPYKAQDTGFQYFRWLREQHPERNAFYVIDPESPDYGRVAKLGNVIHHRSPEHIRAAMAARRLIGSHHSEYLLPTRAKWFVKKVKATRVFLQHGVMGTKNMVLNYGKRASEFHSDLFIVSSPFEKEMIVNDFGFDPEEVVVTGLSRFDTLLTAQPPVRDQILVIPTWRDWLLSRERFAESEYLERWSEFLQGSAIRAALGMGIEVVFIIHPNMAPYIDFFRAEGVRFLKQGEIDVQSLIKSSSLMVTDYSSVGFDFALLERPIVYFQFDQRRFLGPDGSHLSLEDDLPGEIVGTAEELDRAVSRYVENGFKPDQEYIERGRKYFEFGDLNSNRRITEAVEAAHGTTGFAHRHGLDEFSSLAAARFRRSGRYFPVMKAVYRSRRLMPKDNSLIVFESGLGNQYGGNPKYIDQRLDHYDHDLEVVWIDSTTRRLGDPSKRKIERLSPDYYRMLARAGMWVNEQNFPYYLEPGPGTKYLQTWHGTPLKRLLYDIDDPQGRDDNYIERVGLMASYWDYLLSPSPTATAIFRSAFRFEGEILETGYPRNDLFYAADRDVIARSVRSRLRIPEDKKIILYAPTFRDNSKAGGKFVLDVSLDLPLLEETLGGDYVLLVRQHGIVDNSVQTKGASENFVFDVSDYHDSQELLLVADCLVTDYSSVMFDYANLQRPMVFFAYDLEQYKRVRGMYFDYESGVPGPVVQDNHDLVEQLRNLDGVANEYGSALKAFKDKYCAFDDGNASDRVIKAVILPGAMPLSSSL